MPSAVALVPARGGSRRVPGKNIAPLAGHPLIAYTIAAARAERAVRRRRGLHGLAGDRGGRAPLRRRRCPGCGPAEIATATSSDIEWVRHVLAGTDWEVFSLLRPDEPVPHGGARSRAPGSAFMAVPDADSLRAVRPVREHPGKMWRVTGDVMEPYLPQVPGEVPTHSRQTAALEPLYVQDSSLEIAWTRIVADGEIAGRRVVPFFCEGVEGLSIDYPDDLARAEALAAMDDSLLPRVEVPA